jgi:hypothetical protein
MSPNAPKFGSVGASRNAPRAAEKWRPQISTVSPVRRIMRVVDSRGNLTGASTGERVCNRGRRASSCDRLPQAGPSASVERLEEVEEGGEMSRVRIYDLARELKPESNKILEVARRMGILSRLPYGFGASRELDMTDKPDTPDRDNPKSRRPGGQDNR